MAEHPDDTPPQRCRHDSLTPRIGVGSGDTVVIECAEPAGEIETSWSDADVEDADPSRLHEPTGPSDIDGAELAGELVVEILDVEHRGWGRTGHVPDLRLLPEESGSTFIRHWELDHAACRHSVAGLEVHITAAQGGDPSECSRPATRYTVDGLRSGFGLDRSGTHAGGVAGGLLVGDEVDISNCSLSMHMPLDVFGN